MDGGGLCRIKFIRSLINIRNLKEGGRKRMDSMIYWTLILALFIVASTISGLFVWLERRK